MGRFSGKVGFVRTEETKPGVYMPVSTERKYRGDMLSRKIRFDSGEGTIKDFSLNNDVSIVADKFSRENLGYIRYVVLNGLKWEVLSATIEHPRIRLSLGGLYNE